MHLGVVRREAGTVGVIADLADPVRPTLADDQPEQAAPARDRADPDSLLVGHAARDEAGDLPLLVGGAERGVLGADQVADAVDDQLQDALDVQLTGDRAARVVERLEAGAVRVLLRAGPGRLDREFEQADGERARGRLGVEPERAELAAAAVARGSGDA